VEVENAIFKRGAGNQRICHDLCGDVTPVAPPLQRAGIPVHVLGKPTQVVVHEHRKVERAGPTDSWASPQKTTNLADALSVTQGKLRL